MRYPELELQVVRSRWQSVHQGATQPENCFSERIGSVRFFERAPNGHGLANRFHLRGQGWISLRISNVAS